MYEDFSNVNISAELRLYETICRHTGQEAAADLAKRASEIIVELMKERDDLNTQLQSHPLDATSKTTEG